MGKWSWNHINSTTVNPQYCIMPAMIIYLIILPRSILLREGGTINPARYSIEMLTTELFPNPYPLIKGRKTLL